MGEESPDVIVRTPEGVDSVTVETIDDSVDVLVTSDDPGNEEPEQESGGKKTEAETVETRTKNQVNSTPTPSVPDEGAASPAQQQVTQGPDVEEDSTELVETRQEGDNDADDGVDAYDGRREPYAEMEAAEDGWYGALTYFAPSSLRGLIRWIGVFLSFSITLGALVAGSYGAAIVAGLSGLFASLWWRDGMVEQHDVYIYGWKAFAVWFGLIWLAGAVDVYV